MTITFSNRTVVVTGAAGGLGRMCAQVMAARGANVLLVDIADSATAAAEVRAAGGQAACLRADLSNPDAPKDIVAEAVDTFGRIDVVVAAAGILRDRSFAKMSLEDDFEPVLRVHQEAPFRLAHAAWPHMQAAGYGRILFFSSHAGLFGNFGQANYATAKAGLVGLTRTLALEGARHGIQVNALAPLAATDMAAATALADHADVLRAADVAAAAAWLCSEDCPSSGLTLAAAGAALAIVQTVQSEAVVVSDAGLASPERVASCWGRVLGNAVSSEPESAWGAIQPLLKTLRSHGATSATLVSPESLPC